MTNWPDRATEWTQSDLHRYMRQMGVNPDPHEIIPQGVKWIAWPQPPLTEADKERARVVIAAYQDGAGPIAVIKRIRDPRRN